MATFPVYYNVINSSFVHLFFFTMPSRKQKKRAKRREEYLQNQDDELESSRFRYNAVPEKKKAVETAT
jgi:hypothetical protein